MPIQNRTGGVNDKAGGHHNRAFVIRDGDAPPSFMGVQLHHIQRQNGDTKSKVSKIGGYISLSFMPLEK